MDQFEAVKAECAKHMTADEYCENDKHYTIYNIYYDTEQDDVILHSLSKPFFKEKLRLRSYNPIVAESDIVYLELKNKVNGIVYKRRSAMTLGEAERFVETGEKPQLASFIDNQVANEIAYFLSRYRVSSKLYLSYERLAFFGNEDRGLRVTFDRNILTRREHVDFRSGDYGHELLASDVCLMEVKFYGAMPLWLTVLLSGLRAYCAGFSKYGTEYKQYATHRHQYKSKQPDTRVPVKYNRPA